MSTYRTADLSLPFARAVHPRSARAQELTEAWARRCGLLRSPEAVATFRALGYGRLMSTLCPDAPLDGLSLVTDWNSLFFVTDDQQNVACVTGRVGRYEELVASLRRIIGGDTRPTADDRHPLAVALRDLLRRSLPGRSGHWVARFRRHLERWLDGHLRENAYRTGGTVPGPDEYVLLRRDASTVLPTFDLVELVEGAAVPESLYHSPPYQTLVLGTADVMCWINDIHSLHTERGDPMNLVTVLEHHLGLGTQRAVDTVAARVAARVVDLLAATRSLPAAMDGLGIPAAAQEPVMRCVRDQQSWAASMETWDRTDTIRFADAESPGAGRVASYVEDLLLDA
ncbi:terpene synthase family protein [Micromonospora haikouensis]|uniref:terpene synthase family protein n=1 Tax=Micromonospora haikouensis TaxID=686309 RepID=UPI00379F5A35